MIIIDANNLIIGRLAAFTAKKALLGESINIINSEKAVLTGGKKDILQKYHKKRDLGVNPRKGPFFPRRADLILKRTIRGMLPHKQAKGAAAFRRIKCYLGVPEKLLKDKAITIENANIKKLENLKYMSLENLAKELGAK